MLRGNWPKIRSFSVSLDMLQMHDVNLVLDQSPQGVHKVAGKPVHIEQPGAHCCVSDIFKSRFSWYACLAKVGRRF